jgi:hypothetical protein
VIFAAAAVYAVRFVARQIQFGGVSPGAVFGVLLLTGAIALSWRAYVDLGRAVRRLRR